MMRDKLFGITLCILFIKGFIINFWGYFDLVNLLADVLVVICALKTKMPVQKIENIVGKPILIALSLFFVVGIFSDMVNHISAKTMFWGVKNFIRFFLLTYSIIGRYKILSVNFLVKLIYKMFYLNIFAVIFEYSTGRVGDNMGGIFLGNGDLAIFLVISLVFFTSNYMYGKEKVGRIIFFYIISFVIAMFAEIKFLYLVIPFCAYLTYIFIKRMTILNCMFFVMSCFCVVPILKYSLSFYYDSAYIEAIFNDEERDEYLSNDGYNLGLSDNGFNRNTCIENTQILFLRDVQSSMIGYGLGSASNSKSFGTWIADRYRFTGYFFFTASYVLVETGWIGFILFLSVYFFIFMRFMYFYLKAQKQKEKYWAAIGAMLGILTFLFIWYNSSPYVDYYLPFMMWGFCFLGVLKNNDLKV